MKLRDCLFCKAKQYAGSISILVVSEFVWGSGFYIFCQNCKACGPVGDSREKAIMLWNGWKDE